ncbi:MAG: helix-turn-helix domain-containing protein [Actinomycetota bacterium]
MEKLLLTIAEAAETLSISRSKVYELLYAEKIRSVSIGRSRRIPRTALVEYVEQLLADREYVTQLHEELGKTTRTGNG